MDDIFFIPSVTAFLTLIHIITMNFGVHMLPHCSSSSSGMSSIVELICFSLTAEAFGINVLCFGFSLFNSWEYMMVESKWRWVPCSWLHLWPPWCWQSHHHHDDFVHIKHLPPSCLYPHHPAHPHPPPDPPPPPPPPHHHHHRCCDDNIKETVVNFNTLKPR